MAKHALTRRSLLRAGAGSVVGAASLVTFGTGAAGAATTTMPTFTLDATTCVDVPASGKRPAHKDCRSCTACSRHGANKVFATSTQADAGRAHPGCNCAIVAGPELSPAVYDALFSGNARGSVDRRTAAVADLLDNGDASGVPVPMIAGAAPVLAAGVAAGVWWWHSRSSAAPAPVPAVVPTSDRHDVDPPA